MRTGVRPVVIILLAAIGLFGCSKASQDTKSTAPKVGLFPASQMGKWGFIDGAGMFVIKPQFDDAWYFSEGLAFVKVGDRYGYVDESGKLVINPQLINVSSDSEGRTIVKIARMDRTGKFIWNPRFDLALVETAVVRVGDRYGHVDGFGKFVWDPQLDSTCSHSEEVAVVKVADKYGYVDTTGKFVRNPRNDWTMGFSNGLAKVNVGGTWGYLDKTGRFVTNPPVKADDKYGGSIRFYPIWPKDVALSQVWKEAGTSLNYESLGYDHDGYDFTQPFGACPKMQYDISDFRAFTVIVRGPLPEGDIDVRAAYVPENGARETAFIAPMLISDDRYLYLGSIAWRDVRTEAGLWAFTVRVLNPRGEFTLPEILPGRYHVYLMRDSLELCGSDLTISRAANLPALPRSRP